MKSTVAAVFAASLGLTGCVEKVTQVPFLDKVLTASEFSAQQPLRQRVLVFCANDPGRFRNDPNCLNAQQSARSTVVGNGNFPRVQPTVPAWTTSQAKDK